MSFLRINGWAIPTLEGTAGEEHILGGDQSRAFNGTPFRDEHYDKRVWVGQTPPVTEMVAAAIAGTVRGLGQLWPFASDLYSTKGSGVTPGTLGALRYGTGGDGDLVTDESGVTIGHVAGAGALQPQGAVTNLADQNVRDGSEDGTATGWSVVVGGSLASNTVHYIRGSRSMAITCAATSDGGSAVISCDPTTAYVVGVYAKPDAAATITIQISGDNSGVLDTVAVSLSANAWKFIEVTGTTNGSDTTLTLEILSASGTAVFYVDGVQFETGSVASGWVDGVGAAIDLTYPLPDIGLRSSGFTQWGWIYIPASIAVGGGIYTIREAGGANDSKIQILSSRVIRWIQSSSASLVSAALATGWHSFAAVYRANAETGENASELYVDGLSVDTDVATMSPGSFDTLQIGHDSGAYEDEIKLSEIALFPWAAPSAQVAAWHALSAQIPALSRYYVDGDAIPDDPETVLAEGTATDVSYMGAGKDGAWRENLRTIDYEIREV